MDPQLAHDEFFHVRVVIGIVLGLSLTRLLNGLARFVQHPSRDRIYAVHLGWVCFLLLAVVHFWWFEFGLGRIGAWTFTLYVFVIAYSALFFFTCAILFPDRMDEYAGYADYFHSRQAWFYGLLSRSSWSISPTPRSRAPSTSVPSALLPAPSDGLGALALVAIFVRDRRFHAGFVIVALVAEIWWILSEFELLG